MPINYSKWDALELSDDSDIEVHPNVDKRSFIRAKQNQIHADRQARKHRIETLKYERIINDALIGRISSLLSSLKSRAADAETRNPGDVAFEAVMESAAGLDPKDDQPPPRPAGVHGSEDPLPTYTKMMATLLDQVNQALDEKKVEKGDRYRGMVSEIEEHLAKVQGLQKDLHAKLAELELEDGKKITSESIHTGFDSSHVNKSQSSAVGDGAGAAGLRKQDSTSLELLNPNFSTEPSSSSKAATAGNNNDDDNDDDADIEASPAARQFAAIDATDYRSSLSFLSGHPAILTERETDGLLVLAFDAQLAGRGDEARRAVHQALLLQYCRALGRDGVALFFKRITTPGHQARDVFLQDVNDTYAKIRSRAGEINAQRDADGASGEGVEQIQLHAVEPGTVINIKIPPADASAEAEKKGRAIFDAFAPDMRKALETGKLDEVNKVLGRMKVDQAEDLVAKLGEAGILSLEEEIIDATTEQGKQHLKEIEQAAAAAAAAEAADPAATAAQTAQGSSYPDPD